MSSEVRQLSLSETLKGVGESLDTQIEGLSLWTRGRSSALYHLFTVLEDMVRVPFLESMARRDIDFVLNSDNARQNLEHAITPLVAVAHRVCSVDDSGPPPSFEEDAYEEALEALEFGAAYDSVTTILESVINKKLLVDVDGNTLRVSQPVAFGEEHEARAQFNAFRESTSDPHPFPVFEVLRSRVLAEELTRSLPPGGSPLQFAPTVQLRSFIDGMVKRTVAKGHHDPEICVGNYSIADFAVFFSYLYRQSAERQLACIAAKLHGDLSGGVSHLVPFLTFSEIEDAIVGSGLLRRQVFDPLFEDLVYDPTLPNTDIYFQPLVPAYGGYIVSPISVTANKWERNLKRLWALKHQSEYATAIQKDTTALAVNVANWFIGAGFSAVANRRIEAAGAGSRDGEVDVAVFDTRVNTLLLAEVKWLTGPAEPREVRRADQEIVHAIQQVKNARKVFETNPAAFTRQLFPGASVGPNAATRVRLAVISRDHMPSCDVWTDEIPTIDYRLLESYFATGAKGGSLNRMIDAVLEAWAAPIRNVHYEVRQVSMPVGGYNIEGSHIHFLPSLINARSHSMPKVGRNEACPCGNGRKYKHCHGKR